MLEMAAHVNHGVTACLNPRCEARLLRSRRSMVWICPSCRFAGELGIGLTLIAVLIVVAAAYVGG